MSTSEKPRDVSGVELLMNNHQGHKAEIDAREDNYGDVYSLGKVIFQLLVKIRYKAEKDAREDNYGEVYTLQPWQGNISVVSENQVQGRKRCQGG